MSYFDTDRSGEFTFGEPRSTANIVGVCVHTTEGIRSAQATADTADSVTTYQATSQTGSYHVMVGIDGKRIRQNTDDWVTWSTGNKGNDILLHVCVVGMSAQSRAEWLAQDRMLRGLASVIRYWCDRYRIPLRKVTAAGLPGILGHTDTRVWGGTDHTDPGPNFPYDRVIELARGTASAVTPSTPKETGMSDAAVKHIEDYIAGYLWPAISDGKDNRYQLTGSRDLVYTTDPRTGRRVVDIRASFPGHKQLGGRTVPDALGAIGAFLGVPGFVDTLGVIPNRATSK